MASSSSTSLSCRSSSGSNSVTLPPPDFSSLPVMAMREKIVEKIIENRVTLIIGETGCGKSSQVPQFLLQKGLEPILCTQPRRFAVVAVARMVAQARGGVVGGEVGYHIGHLKVTSPRSRIIFKTAGVLLDEMRDKGMDALHYKVIILDEVHERSVESDLVLACVKQFLLKNKDLRLVLMSATADITRYRDYFRDLGRQERVEVLAIPSSTQKMIFQRRVSYLEQVAGLLKMDSESVADTCSCMSFPSFAEATIKPEMHRLIHDLVLHIHENEPDLEKSILIFLPTYYSLEKQWKLLKPFSSSFKVHILHRSIDTEQALMAMKICKSHRKVILATNIAESSVTIPGVAFVIDSCRSLQVFWDNIRKSEGAELVWVSKSQAEQRRGRTGRTCDGQIYRLVTGSFYSQLDDHEPPSILRLSLRQQVLLICCAGSKAINDPKVLLQKALDPPDTEVVDDALSLLVQIHALESPIPNRRRYEPTFYGRLLASMTLSFDASVLIIKFGEIGMLREGIIIGILMDLQPLPILHPFGQENLSREYLESYFPVKSDNIVSTSKRDVIFMANLNAYQFWQRVYKDKYRLDSLKQLLKYDELEAHHLPKFEDQWCSFHHLAHKSLHLVAEMYEDILNTVHRFRPKFLVTSNGLPSYYDSYEYEHICLVEPSTNVDSFQSDEEQPDPSSEASTCLALPFVAPDEFQADLIAEKLANVFKEIRIQYLEDSKGNHENVHILGSENASEVPMCRYFINGSCNRGSECPFSHSRQAKRPVCNFFLSYQGCRNGDSCFFSHDVGAAPLLLSRTSQCLPEDDCADAAYFLRLLPTKSDGYILILDDTDLHFTIHLTGHCDPDKLIVTTCLPDTTIFDESLSDVRILWGLNHPYQTIISYGGQDHIPWTQVRTLLWFARFNVGNDDLKGQQSFMEKFFEYLAIRILGDSLYQLRLIITMNNARFSKLGVEKLARDCFFFLTESFPFDESKLGRFLDVSFQRKPMTVSRPVSYVFDLHPPTEIQFGNYAAELHECLHQSQSK